MPDLVKYSDITPTQTADVNNNALVSMANVENNAYVSGVVTMTTLGTKLNNNIEYATALQTTNKTIIGAINEVAQGGGGGGSSTLAGLTDVTLTTPTDGQALIYDSATDKWVNGAGGGGNANIWEGTQAEYDALVNKDPDTVYFITDTNGDGSQFQPVVYSEDEREIGVWTDGKPLYEKTVLITALPSVAYTVTNYPHNISNIDTICNYITVVRWTSGQVSVSPRFGLFTANANDIPPASIICEIDKTNIMFTVGSDRSSMNANVTIRYTKTTDQPGSGQWTPQGVPAVHYSTNEQVVGTWIDGSTICERTYTYSTPITLPNTDWYTTDIPNSDKAIILSVTSISATGMCFPLGCTRDSGNTLKVFNLRTSAVSCSALIIRYVKSST